jgi:hypothetical protein
MDLMEFFRTEQFAKEVADNLNKPQIQFLIKKGKEALEFANHIKSNFLYFDYEITPDELDNDIRCFNWNIRELRKALNLKRNEPIQYVSINNEMYTPIYLN